MEAEKNAGHGYFTACERRHLLWLEVFLGPPGFNSHSRFVLHASSFRSCKNTVTLAKCVCTSGAGSLAPVRRWSGEALPMFVRPLPHPHELPYSWSRSSREDANTSYLTSSRQSRPSPPPFSSLRWNRPQQQALWSSAPATRLRYLRPPLPAMQLPQQRRTQKHNQLG